MNVYIFDFNDFFVSLSVFTFRSCHPCARFIPLPRHTDSHKSLAILLNHFDFSICTWAVCARIQMMILWGHISTLRSFFSLKINISLLCFMSRLIFVIAPKRSVAKRATARGRPIFIKVGVITIHFLVYTNHESSHTWWHNVWANCWHVMCISSHSLSLNFTFFCHRLFDFGNMASSQFLEKSFQLDSTNNFIHFLFPSMKKKRWFSQLIFESLTNQQQTADKQTKCEKKKFYPSSPFGDQWEIECRRCFFFSLSELNDALLSIWNVYLAFICCVRMNWLMCLSWKHQLKNAIRKTIRKEEKLFK